MTYDLVSEFMLNIGHKTFMCHLLDIGGTQVSHVYTCTTTKTRNMGSFMRMNENRKNCNNIGDKKYLLPREIALFTSNSKYGSETMLNSCLGAFSPQNKKSLLGYILKPSHIVNLSASRSHITSFKGFLNQQDIVWNYK